MIRSYQPSDQHETARIWYESGLEAYPYLPQFQALDFATAEKVFAEMIVPASQLWVYQTDAQIRGFVALQDTYIDRLYVAPAYQGRGIGQALLNHAKDLHPDYLHLHTHQANMPARTFYERAGFVAHQFGISPPPENVPDVEYRWHSEQP